MNNSEPDSVSTADAVHIFWDNSNIFHAAQQVADHREGSLGRSALRLQFDNVLTLAAANRPIVAVSCVASSPAGSSPNWVGHLRRLGVQVDLFERSTRDGREQAVDQALQVRMLRARTDFAPAVAVLLTGDGAGFSHGEGFGADLARLRGAGWGVEVLSWKHSCSRTLRSWIETEGEFIALDDYYEAITFTEGLRRVSPLSLARRRRVGREALSA